MVALSRVRGLKLNGPQGKGKNRWVALSRVRGLKLQVIEPDVDSILSHSHECVD